MLGGQHTRSIERLTIGRLDLAAHLATGDRSGDRTDFRAVWGLELGVVADRSAVVLGAVVVRQAIRLAAGPRAAGLPMKVGWGLQEYEREQKQSGTSRQHRHEVLLAWGIVS